jgi:hypothetical protein
MCERHYALYFESLGNVHARLYYKLLALRQMRPVAHSQRHHGGRESIRSAQATQAARGSGAVQLLRVNASLINVSDEEL